MPATELDALIHRIGQATEHVDGWLSDRETAFLVMAAAHPTTAGAVLEIGSFRGRSTIALALAMQHVGRGEPGPGSQLVAVDPMLDDDPLLERPLPRGAARQQFELNLARSGVRTMVEFHQAFSYELASDWSRPLRLLWIDGDHSYPSSKQDFDLFLPYLADGAILAMHDVLSRYDGCIRVFTEDVLSSPHFGAAGLCGSIGWAQYWHVPRRRPAEEAGKRRLLRQLSRLVPYHCRAEAPRGLSKLRYKWLRSRVPHRPISPERWQGLVHAA